MIPKLHINGTEDTPEILFDKDNGIFEISGRSLPENANNLFISVFKWLNDYFDNPLPETIFYINLEYFNSASAKKIVELLLLLENHTDKGCKLKIIWSYKQNDFTMQKKGQDLLSIFKIPYEIIVK